MIMSFLCRFHQYQFVLHHSSSSLRYTVSLPRQSSFTIPSTVSKRNPIAVVVNVTQNSELTGPRRRPNGRYDVHFFVHPVNTFLVIGSHQSVQSKVKSFHGHSFNRVTDHPNVNNFREGHGLDNANEGNNQLRNMGTPTIFYLRRATTSSVNPYRPYRHSFTFNFSNLLTVSTGFHYPRHRMITPEHFNGNHITRRNRLNVTTLGFRNVNIGRITNGNAFRNALLFFHSDIRNLNRTTFGRVFNLCVGWVTRTSLLPTIAIGSSSLWVRIASAMVTGSSHSHFSASV